MSLNLYFFVDKKLNCGMRLLEEYFFIVVKIGKTKLKDGFWMRTGFRWTTFFVETKCFPDKHYFVRISFMWFKFFCWEKFSGETSFWRRRKKVRWQESSGEFLFLKKKKLWNIFWWFTFFGSKLSLLSLLSLLSHR